MDIEAQKEILLKKICLYQDLKDLEKKLKEES